MISDGYIEFLFLSAFLGGVFPGLGAFAVALSALLGAGGTGNMWLSLIYVGTVVTAPALSVGLLEVAVGRALGGVRLLVATLCGLLLLESAGDRLAAFMLAVHASATPQPALISGILGQGIMTACIAALSVALLLWSFQVASMCILNLIGIEREALTLNLSPLVSILIVAAIFQLLQGYFEHTLDFTALFPVTQ